MSSTTDQVPNIALPGEVEIPQLGFGVYQVPPDDTAEITTRALQAGYRHIDTAAAYGNEAAVGQAVRASGLDRRDVFITTKCFNDDHGHQQARKAFKASLDRLGMEYVDLYLIHWPVPSHDKYVDTWKAFI
jgi:2,5-diketo-D-gluconate reductase A